MSLSLVSISIRCYQSKLIHVILGLNIFSTWIRTESAINTISGTSMAFPHTAGLLAYPLSLPIQVLQSRCFYFCLPPYCSVRSLAHPRHCFLLRTSCSPCLDIFDAPSHLGGYCSYPPSGIGPSPTQEGSSRVVHSGRSLCVATQDSSTHQDPR